ncbi:MAG: M15 family metallopeptidase [Pyrinomonadaceae bacterium]
MTRKNIFYQTVVGVVLGGVVLYFAIVELNVYGQKPSGEKISVHQSESQSLTTSDNTENNSKAVYSAAFVRAAAENARLKDSLRWDFGGKLQSGWSIYSALINQTVKTAGSVGSPEFARAISVWQARSQLSPTGVIDRETLEAFIKIWQSQRLNRSTFTSPDKLYSAPISDFYDLTRNAELLKCERRTYAAYRQMLQAAAKDPSLSLKLTKTGELASEEKFLRIISAFRSREYQDQLRKKEPNAGRAQLAKHSPHFTGHAIDIYVGGDPVSTKDANRTLQVQTPVYKWLVKNAHRFGFYPYFYEPWHWEFVPGE